jgi:hypothetical protein
MIGSLSSVSGNIVSKLLVHRCVGSLLEDLPLTFFFLDLLLLRSTLRFYIILDILMSLGKPQPEISISTSMSVVLSLTPFVSMLNGLPNNF